MENYTGPLCEWRMKSLCEPFADYGHLNFCIYSTYVCLLLCRKALEITKKHFGAILKEQDFLSTDEQLEKVLGLLPFNLQGQLREEFSSPKAHSTDYRWRRIQAEVTVCVCMCRVCACACVCMCVHACLCVCACACVWYVCV